VCVCVCVSKKSLVREFTIRLPSSGRCVFGRTINNNNKYNKNKIGGKQYNVRSCEKSESVGNKRLLKVNQSIDVTRNISVYMYTLLAERFSKNLKCHGGTQNDSIPIIVFPFKIVFNMDFEHRFIGITSKRVYIFFKFVAPYIYIYIQCFRFVLSVHYFIHKIFNKIRQ
jgi:hypothetical protein